MNPKNELLWSLWVDTKSQEGVLKLQQSGFSVPCCEPGRESPGSDGCCAPKLGVGVPYLNTFLLKGTIMKTSLYFILPGYLTHKSPVNP